jgi:hypothetical protein
VCVVKAKGWQNLNPGAVDLTIFVEVQASWFRVKQDHSVHDPWLLQRDNLLYSCVPVRMGGGIGKSIDTKNDDAYTLNKVWDFITNMVVVSLRLV